MADARRVGRSLEKRLNRYITAAHLNIGNAMYDIGQVDTSFGVHSIRWSAGFPNTVRLDPRVIGLPENVAGHLNSESAAAAVQLESGDRYITSNIPYNHNVYPGTRLQQAVMLGILRTNEGTY